MTNHDTTTDKAYAEGYAQGEFIATTWDARTARDSADKAHKTVRRLRNRPGPSRSYNQGIAAGIAATLKAAS